MTRLTSSDTLRQGKLAKTQKDHPFEVMSRYRDPQLQVGENY